MRIHIQNDSRRFERLCMVILTMALKLMHLELRGCVLMVLFSTTLIALELLS